MRSRSSRWSSGVGVSLSNGWMAIVRTCDGRPPPAKPYFVTQPVATSTSRRTLEAPDRRTESSDGIGTLDDEGERSAGALVAILNALAGTTFDPLLESTAVDALETSEGVAAEADTPVDGSPDVGAYDVSLDANDRVTLCREVEPAQRRPQEGTRGHELSRHIRAWNDPRVADEDRAPAGHTATEKEVETNAVGRGDASDAVPTRGEILVLELPLKDDLAMTRRECAARESLSGRGRSREDGNPRGRTRRRSDHERRDAASES